MVRLVQLSKQDKVDIMLHTIEEIQNDAERLHDQVEANDLYQTRRATEEIRSRLLVTMQFAKEIYDDSF